jgi:2-polyprenyl-3-methyl-5-hydroxy-6-metoxy-1,4-benzoquinol methylase
MQNTCAFCGLETLRESKFVRPNSWNRIRKYWYCKLCRGFTLLPRLSDQDMNDLYTNYYNEIVVDGSFKTIDKKFKDLENHLSLMDKGQIILDFGCGVDGYLPSLSSKYHLRIDGFEVSAKTIQILQDRFPQNTFYDRVTFQASTESYDLIVLSDVLEHLSDPRTLLDSLKYRLKPGGQIWIQQPLENNLTLFTLLLKSWAFIKKSEVSKTPPFHVTLGSKYSMLKLIHLSDYDVVKLKVSETIWPAQARIYFRNPKQVCLTLIKYFDFFLARIFRDYGTRVFFLIKRKHE